MLLLTLQHTQAEEVRANLLTFIVYVCCFLQI
jgi:hypothetical protein